MGKLYVREQRLKELEAENAKLREALREYEALMKLRRLVARVEEDDAALRETVERAEEELRLLERWAGEQNAGNAFAAQVRLWALSHLERRIPAARAAALQGSRPMADRELQDALADFRESADYLEAMRHDPRSVERARLYRVAIKFIEQAEAREAALREALFRVTVKLREYVGPSHPTVQAGEAALAASTGETING